MLSALVALLACDGWLDTRPVPTHRVAKGETLGEIATHYGVTVEELVRWNQIGSPDRIEVGQVLVVWTDAVPSPAAPAKATSRKRRTGSTLQVQSRQTGRPSLPLPPPQACKPPPDVTGEAGVAASAGLTEAEVSAAMSAFVAHTLACVPEGWGASGTLTVSMSVGCDGRVASVEVVDSGAFPAEMSQCVVEVLGFTPFPPHDQRDGFAFAYPLTFQFSGH